MGLLPKVNPQRFRKFYIKQKGLGLTVTKSEELLVFFNFLQTDPDIQDIRWAAYMLATAHKETSCSFKAAAKEILPKQIPGYATAIPVKDTIGCRGPVNATYQNEYYGRGYVQLTHDRNYKAIGKAYGIGDALYINPDRAYEPAIAYFAASYGMRNGSYTGHSLSKHINGKHCNYKLARQIINGSNCDMEIAQIATRTEMLLRLCVK